MAQVSWSTDITRIIGSNIKAARQRADRMSAQKLADLCAEIGHPIRRDVIANLENGRRASIPVADLMVIAEALRVPALSLVFDPIAAGDEIERVPGTKCKVWEASDDFAGNRPAGLGGGRPDAASFATWRRSEVLRSLTKWEAAAFEYVSDADALQEIWNEQLLLEQQGIRRGTDPATYPFGDQYLSDTEYQEEIAALEVAAKRALKAIRSHRQELESLQVRVWPLTEILRTRYAAVEAEESTGADE